MMLTKHYNPVDRNNGDVLSENKVNKATSPMMFDEEKAAAKELEQIFAAQKELDKIRTELARERELRMRLEAKFSKVRKDLSPSDDEDIDESEGSELEMDYKSKRPRIATTRGTSPRNNLDIIVRAIREIEGDAFSRSTTPTCGAQERNIATGTFRPISAGADSTRVSPVTPVCAS